MSDVGTAGASQVLEESVSTARTLTGAWKNVVATLAVLITLFHIFALTVFAMDPWLFLGLSMGLFCVIGFLLFPATPSGKKSVQPLDIVLCLASIGFMVYLGLNYDQMYDRVGLNPTTWDTVWGTVAVLLSLELTRRVLGWFFPHHRGGMHCLRAVRRRAARHLGASRLRVRSHDQHAVQQRGAVRFRDVGRGHLHRDVRDLRRVPARHRRRPGVHRSCHGDCRPGARRTRQSGGDRERAVRDHLRQLDGQRGDGRNPHHSADETPGLCPRICRRRRSGGIDRRTADAAGHGFRRVRARRGDHDALSRRDACGADSRDLLFRHRLFRDRFRGGQAGTARDDARGDAADQNRAARRLAAARADRRDGLDGGRCQRTAWCRRPWPASGSR